MALPKKLAEIKRGLERRDTYNFTGETELLEELEKIDQLIDRINIYEADLETRRIAESISTLSVTSGPEGYCSCCGNRL